MQVFQVLSMLFSPICVGAILGSNRGKSLPATHKALILFGMILGMIFDLTLMKLF